VQNTDKIHIQHLAEICAQKGMKQVVLSPGSRCAPLVIAFNRHPDLECFSIVDERSAAFFALGLAQQSGLPVGLICTSGSAVLNYAPAVAEAFYQKIPLVLLTADRPNEWIDQGENQSIQQFEVFKNYIKKSYQLPVNVVSKEDIWYCDRLISEAINTSSFPDFGPVHINIPLREPLYNLVDVSEPVKPKIVKALASQMIFSEDDKKEITTDWHASNKKLIIVGLGVYKQELNDLLQQISLQKDTVILYESISNIKVENAFGQIDPLVEIIEKKNLQDFIPDVVLTFGAGIVSKKLKFWLRKAQVAKHWHLSNSFEHWDNLQALSKVINLKPETFLSYLLDTKVNKESTYFGLWQNLNTEVRTFTKDYLKAAPYSDFNVFKVLMNSFPENANIHFGNSTPVRYSNLLALKNQFVNANRGVSGIDGQVSTALGASNLHKKMTICITGDLALMYDSNALWNNYLHPNFKVILINNDGGNIFRIIPGPNKLEELETYFETKNTYEAEYLAKLHHLKYFKAVGLVELESVLNVFYEEKDAPALLEIKTDGAVSAKVLSEYFQKLLVK